MKQAFQKKFFSNIHKVVIVAAKRTPIGSLNGALKEVQATSLGAVAIKGCLKQANLSTSEIDEVILGNVISAGIGQAPARQAAIKAQLSTSTICTTINKVCSSGMKSITMGAQSIALGDSKIVVAGGFESMSNVPHYIFMRKAISFGGSSVSDGIQLDGLSDFFDKVPMGVFAEKTVKDNNISRESQDKYCHQSYKRAIAADFSEEIEPVEIFNTKTKKNQLISEDEEPKNYMPDKINTLKPAFDLNGTITAANSSKINDGACALILMSEEEAAKRNLKPLARILSYQDAEIKPCDFSISPTHAVQKLLKKNNLKINNIDAFEVNEAFSSVAIANMKLLDLPEDKVNVNGGAVALGHPIGMSGARIVLSLMTVLKQKKGKLGVASICNGGGGSTAILIENLRI